MPDRLVLAPAEQLAGLQVPVRDAAVRGNGDEGVVRGLQDQAHAFALGVDAVARRAQFHRHPLRQLQRAAALGREQPHDERQQHAQADAGERDRDGRTAIERCLEPGRRVHDDGPRAAGAVDRRLVAQQRLAVGGAAAGRPVEQGVRRGRQAVVDLDQQVARMLAAQAAHQVVHAERRIHPADDGGAPGVERIVHEAGLVHRHVHEEAGLAAVAAFLHQHHLAGGGRVAGIARLFHGRAPYRFAEHVVAEGAQVAPRERFDAGDRRDHGTRPGRLDRVVAKALGAHGRDVRVDAAGRDDRGDAQRLDAGEALVQVQQSVVLGECGAVDVDRAAQEAARGQQHFLVDVHAPVDAGGHVACTEIEIACQFARSGPLRVAGHHIGHDQRGEKRERGQEQGEVDRAAGRRSVGWDGRWVWTRHECSTLYSTREKVAMVHCRQGKRAVMTGYAGAHEIGAQQGAYRPATMSVLRHADAFPLLHDEPAAARAPGCRAGPRRRPAVGRARARALPDARARVRVPARHRRQDRRVHDAQPVNAAYAQLRVAHRRVRAARQRAIIEERGI